MSSAANSGKLVNEVRTQNGVLQNQIIKFGGAIASIDITGVTSAYVAWIHPEGACSFTYYGKQIFKNPDLIDAGYGDDIAIGDLVTVTGIESPYPINLKECVVTMTAGTAKVSFGRV